MPDRRRKLKKFRRSKNYTLTNFNFRIDQLTLDLLRATARKRKCSVSALVRGAIISIILSGCSALDMSEPTRAAEPDSCYRMSVQAPFSEGIYRCQLDGRTCYLSEFGGMDCI